MDQQPLNNNQGKTKSNRGGKRPGAGRKVGSVNKIQGGEFLEEYFKLHGNSLKEDLVQDMYNARMRNDHEMLFRYQTAFAKYYFSDVQQVDVTSNGQTIEASFSFIPIELQDWTQDGNS